MKGRERKRKRKEQAGGQRVKERIFDGHQIRIDGETVNGH